MASPKRLRVCSRQNLRALDAKNSMYKDSSQIFKLMSYAFNYFKTKYKILFLRFSRIHVALQIGNLAQRANGHRIAE